MRKLIVLIVAVCATLALAGCDKTLDTNSIEPQIKQTVAKQSGRTIKSVDCPGDIKSKAGQTFECTVTTADGKSAKIKAKQTDGDGRVVFQPNGIRFK